MIHAGMDRLKLSEDDWLGIVTDLAQLHGWHWMHIRPAMKRDGSWRTPIAGDLGAGWPDLVLVRDRQLLFIELKADQGSLTEDQRHVHTLLRSAATVDTWRPTDWPRIMEALA